MFMALTVSTASFVLVMRADEDRDGVTTAREVAGEAVAGLEVSGATVEGATDKLKPDAETLLAMDSVAVLLSELALMLFGVPATAW